MAVVINGSGTVTGLAVGGLPDGTVDADTLATDSVTAVKIPDTVEADLKSGRKNLIINGGFDVWQRGTSFTGAVYSADRWKTSTSESATSITKTANRDNKNTLKITFGSVISCNLDQRIEGFGNVGHNQQVTLSFWVRGSKAITGEDFCRIRNHTTSTTLETLYYDITTSWTKVTKTFSADNTWSKDDVARLYLFSAVSSSWVSGDWVEFSDVQLELGDTATDFEHRSYGEELALCQRYYYFLGQGTGSNTGDIGIGSYYSSSYLDVVVQFPVTMRATPTVDATSGTNYYVSFRNSGADYFNSFTLSKGSPSAAAIGNSSEASGTGGQATVVRYNNASARVAFDSEL